MSERQRVTTLIALAITCAASGAFAQSDTSGNNEKAGALGQTASAGIVTTPTGTAMQIDEYWSDRRHIDELSAERKKLQASLPSAETVDSLDELIADSGYKVTAIIEQSADAVEYEVVKGIHSFEVSAALNDAGEVRDIVVGNNIWRADETERAMNDEGYEAVATVLEPEIASRVRDSDRMADWNEEHQILRGMLPAGEPIDSYMRRMGMLGYRVTAVNDSAPDHIEWEVVRGNDSFEVQLHKTPDTDQVNEVDVTMNIWPSKETKQALSE